MFYRLNHCAAKPVHGHMQLRSYQQGAIDAAYKMWRQGARRLLITAATGCHARGQGIIMFDGTVRAVESICVGDQLMGPDSTPRRVLALARGRQEMVRIIPVKGDPWVVNLDHMLTLAMTGEGRESWHDMSVRDWLALHKHGKHLRKLVRVGVTFPCEPDQPFVSPYSLGVLIGDGELVWSGTVNKPDAELHAAMQEEARAMGAEWVVSHFKDQVIGRFHGTRGPGGNKVKTELLRLGLRVGSGSKFIPRSYLVASRADRLELLAGLLDTDGHMGTGGYDWISKSERLAHDLLFLARSLGLAAYMRPCEKWCQTGAGGRYYRVSISGDCSIIPCRIPRKQAPPRAQIKNSNHTGFAVERLPEDEYFGFELDGDSRYLLDDFTVTHNTGKSVIFKKMAQDAASRGRCVLLLVEGQDLVEQAATHMRLAGLKVAVEMADQRVDTQTTRDLLGLGTGPDVVVASVDSMVRRVGSYPRDFFGLIIADECFPAGTLVDSRRIETVKAGDFVRSFNHDSGKVEMRRVVRLFKNPIKALIRLHLSDGTSIACTPEHPLAVTVADGITYRAANDCAGFTLLRNHDISQDMHCVWNGLPSTKLDLENGPDLLPPLQGSTTSCATQDGDDALRLVLDACGAAGETWTAASSFRSTLLLGAMQGGLRQQAQFRTNGEHQPPLRIGENACSQPHVTGGSESEGECIAARNGAPPIPARWQRPACTGTATPASGSTRVAHGSRCDHWQAEAAGLPPTLQDGHGEPGAHGVDRGRWRQPRINESAGCRCSQDCLSPGPRVDRVEVLQPGGDGRFGGVCGDGYVYNFEVEGNHNYFVDDLLVHNCHHAAARSYRVVFGHFGLPVPRDPKDGGGKYPDAGGCLLLGLTATPDRTDKKTLVPDIFEEVAFEYPILQAIQDGWLVPVEQEMCHLPGYDISKVRTVAGELNAADLAAVLEPLVTPMVEHVIRVADGRRTLIYSVLKKLAFATTDALRAVSNGSASIETIVGETSREERGQFFEAFRRGSLQYMSSVATLIEGVDLPEAVVAAVLRPTKSGLVYTQIAGRVFRPLPGILEGLQTADQRRAAIKASAKPNCVLLDFAGNAGRHKLVPALDLFADDLTDAQRNLAGKMLDAGEVTDVLDAIARANEIIADMERERAGRSIISTFVDPFDVFAFEKRRDAFDRPPTDGQIATLLRHGAVKGNLEKNREAMVEMIYKKFDRASASAFIDVVVKRTDAKKATIRQVMRLVSCGIPALVAREMSFDRAGKAMTELASNRWEPLPAWINKYKEPEVTT